LESARSALRFSQFWAIAAPGWLVSVDAEPVDADPVDADDAGFGAAVIGLNGLFDVVVWETPAAPCPPKAAISSIDFEKVYWRVAVRPLCSLRRSCSWAAWRVELPFEVR